jgi:intracellular sulfur oxidation DsrE/DsrF family protein
MAEIRTVTTLRRKRDEISASIRLYERQLAQARADLAHVTAAIRIFEASGDAKEMAHYVDTHRLLKRGEPIAICKAALANGPLSTRELAHHVMAAKGLDVGDKVLAKSIGYSLIHSLRMQHKRGRLILDGKRHGVSVWRLPPDPVLI